jgi:hypothetical protein
VQEFRQLGATRVKRGRRGEMTYYFSTTLNATFDDAVTLTKEALNFSMVSQINMSDNLRHALNKEFRHYLILESVSQN